MKRLFIFSLFFVWATSVLAETIVNPPNSIVLEGGWNYYGTSIALRFSEKIIDHLWANLEVEQGNFSLLSKNGQSTFGFANYTGHDINVNININTVVSIFISGRLSENGMFRWLNSLGVGISQFNLTAEDSYTSGSPPNNFYQGGVAISAYSIYTDLHLMDVYPPESDLSFSLGVKGNTAFLKSPITISLSNGAGRTTTFNEFSGNGDSLMFPYFELFLSAGYSFR